MDKIREAIEITQKFIIPLIVNKQREMGKKTMGEALQTLLAFAEDALLREAVSEEELAKIIRGDGSRRPIFVEEKNQNRKFYTIVPEELAHAIFNHFTLPHQQGLSEAEIAEIIHTHGQLIYDDIDEKATHTINIIELAHAIWQAGRKVRGE